MSGVGTAYQARVAALRARMTEIEAEALLVTAPVNVRYLTGLSASAAQLLVTKDRLHLGLDDRYARFAHEALAISALEVELIVGASGRLLEALAAVARQLRNLAVEGNRLTWAQMRELSAVVGSTPLIDAENIVEQLRLVKDAGEQARIQAAAALADAALIDVLGCTDLGTTERALAQRLDARVRELGASGPSFNTIVSSGPNSAKPHTTPSSRPIDQGDFVLIDFGAVVDGYHSDMTRTIWWGDRSPQQEDLYSSVQSAYQAVRDAVLPGARLLDLGQLAIEVLASCGLGEATRHAAGHNIGLEVHERPYLSSSESEQEILEVGNVITVEPGAYVEGFGGVRIEDILVVTTEGARSLSRAPMSVEPSTLDSGHAETGHEKESVRAQTDTAWVDAEKLDEHARFLVGDDDPSVDR